MDAFSSSVAPGQAAFNATVNDQVIATFYKDAKYMPFQSEAEGRPVFKPMDMVLIQQVGEVDSLKEEVHEGHRMRWPAQWASYERNQEQIIAGTPLIELFPGLPEVVAQLKTVNVHTIEGLIKVPDSSATQTKVPFLSEWKKKANQWAERMQKANGFTELERELDIERKKNREMLERLAALEARVSEPVAQGKNARKEA